LEKKKVLKEIALQSKFEAQLEVYRRRLCVYCVNMGRKQYVEHLKIACEGQ
jgi:hypothetical protein